MLAALSRIESSACVPLQTRGLAVGFKTHKASAKRFRIRGSGSVKFRPSGRQHGMHQHTRDRNRDKGKRYALDSSSPGKRYQRLRKLNLKVPKGEKPSPYHPISAKIASFSWNPIIQESQGIRAVLADELNQAMAPVPRQTSGFVGFSLTQRLDMTPPLLQRPRPLKTDKVKQWRVAQ